jgi:hypothetical protein
MTAAQALAKGVDTPTLRELAGLPRHADPRDIRDTFEQALAELGIVWPDHHQAQRYALHRLATRFSAGEAALAELASDECLATEAETAEEQAFVALLPPCTCCIEYTLGLDEATWEARLRSAAAYFKNLQAGRFRWPGSGGVVARMLRSPVEPDQDQRSGLFRPTLQQRIPRCIQYEKVGELFALPMSMPD